MTADNTIDKSTAAADFLSTSISKPIPFGIILGTGSGVVAEKIDIQSEVDYAQIPHFPSSTALGHKGSLLLGKLGNHDVIALNGRFHLYEGHRVDDATIAVRAMHHLGVTHLFITNAAGGLNPQFRSGDVMIIDSHIDLMGRISANSSLGVTCQRPTADSDVYDHEMAESARTIARTENFVLLTGTYAGLLGPNYETRAEYRMLRRIGADVAGMSTIPEVYVAAKLQMKVLGLSIVTNVAKPDVLEETSGQEVVDAAELAAPRIHSLIHKTIEKLAAQ